MIEKTATTEEAPMLGNRREGITYQGKTGCGPVYVTVNDKEVFIKLGKRVAVLELI